MQLPKNITTNNYYFIFDPEHLNYRLKQTTSEKTAELYGEDNERQLCVGDWTI